VTAHGEDQSTGGLGWSRRTSYVNGVAFPVDGGFMGGIATGQIDLRAMMKNASPQ